MNVLSIVIPLFNKWNFTRACLNDLAQLPADHEIILIDNASSDETSTTIHNHIESLARQYLQGAHIKYVRNEENTFHSKACNQGFRLSTGENILFLNNDIKITANHNSWTQPLISACQSTKGIVGPTMGQLDSNLNFVKEAAQQLPGNSYLGGWCIAASRETWKKMDVSGGEQIWNEAFPFYFNDTDLSFRARKKGVPLTCVSLPGIAHFGKVSAQQINIPKLYTEGRAVFLKHWSKK